MKALDASVVIGLLDPDDAHHADAVAALTAALAARTPIVMSASAYSEALVHALSQDRREAVDDLIDDAGISIEPIDRRSAACAAALRVRHRSLRLPDALALSTALDHDAEFLTFDRDLLRVAKAEAV